MRDKLAGLLCDKDMQAFPSYRAEADWLIEHGVTIPVRCKDCKRYVENKEAFVTYCRRGLQDRYVKPLDFCSYGEREDNEN